MQGLQTLTLFDNPVAQEKHYRDYVIFHLPSVKVLDRHEITFNERMRAQRLFDTDNQLVRDRLAFGSRVETRGCPADTSAGAAKAIKQDGGGKAEIDRSMIPQQTFDSIEAAYEQRRQRKTPMEFTYFDWSRVPRYQQRRTQSDSKDIMVNQLQRVRMTRPDSGTPWGFRLQGGRDFNSALTIQKVSKGGMAERHGVCVGDRVVSIGGDPTHNWTHQQAQQAVIRCGNELDLGLASGGGGFNHAYFQPQPQQHQFQPAAAPYSPPARQTAGNSSGATRLPAANASPSSPSSHYYPARSAHHFAKPNAVLAFTLRRHSSSRPQQVSRHNSSSHTAASRHKQLLATAVLAT
uniref:PDZ domain-containing protein n=1 Tax=Macrostomum lignano TaxID=282301 RepID=A0A1I8F1N2_9PLAT